MNWWQLKRGERKKIGTGTLFLNILFKYVLRVNGTSPFPCHYTSRISHGDRLIITGKNTSFHLYRCLACSNSVYIQAKNKVYIDENVQFGPGVKIISANHDKDNRRFHSDSNPIVIKDNVWIGSNAVILPGVTLNSGVIVGAGAVVTKSAPEGAIMVGNPASPISADGKQ